MKTLYGASFARSFVSSVVCLIVLLLCASTVEGKTNPSRPPMWSETKIIVNPGSVLSGSILPVRAVIIDLRNNQILDDTDLRMRGVSIGPIVADEWEKRNVDFNPRITMVHLAKYGLWLECLIRGTDENDYLVLISPRISVLNFFTPRDRDLPRRRRSEIFARNSELAPEVTVWQLSDQNFTAFAIPADLEPALLEQIIQELPLQ